MTPTKYVSSTTYLFKIVDRKAYEASIGWNSEESGEPPDQLLKETRNMLIEAIIDTLMSSDSPPVAAGINEKGFFAHYMLSEYVEGAREKIRVMVTALAPGMEVQEIGWKRKD